MKPPRLKPSRIIWKANWHLFVCFGMINVSMFLWSFWTHNVFTVFIFLISVLIACRSGWRGAVFLRRDYIRRYNWNEAWKTSTKKHDGRWATHKEMYEAGMFDGVGRLLGATEDGYLLFEPHKLKPVFSYFLGPQGSGKTSTQVLPSAILSALPTGSSQGAQE